MEGTAFSNSHDSESTPTWLNYLSQQLNNEQLNFVIMDNHHIMGIAGPGSGKTRALVYRAAHLLKSGVPPQQLMLVTFTNKASEEMKDRLEQILGFRQEAIWAGTFHSLGARILRQHPDYFNRTRNFTIMDEDDSQSLWKEIINGYKEVLSEEEVNLFLKKRTAERLVSQSRNSGMNLEEVVREYYPRLEEYLSWLLEIQSLYEKRKEENNAFDFDDLLLKWLVLFENAPAIKNSYLQKFQHVLVDEFQDTNYIQGKLVDIFAQGANVCVVGDDAQSIYGFRFADVENMLSFPQRHPECEVIKLEQNYRSHPEIVDLANLIISYNYQQLPKELFSCKPNGDKPVIAKLRDTYDEAQFVVDRMEDLLNEGIPPGEIAVLYRSSYLASEVEFQLLKRKRPYRTFGGQKLIQKAHIRDILAWLKVVYNTKDTVAWQRIISMQKGLGAATAQKLITSLQKSEQPFHDIEQGKIKPSRGKEGWAIITATLSKLLTAETVPEMIHYILQEGYYQTLVKNYPESWEERYRSIEQLAQYGGRYNNLAEFLESLSLEEALVWDQMDPTSIRNHLTLSTIHSAKGKEWEAVFILALNEGTFPGRMATDLEEERRLFYVAATRAKRYLYLLSREVDFRWGEPTIPGPSIFLKELASHFDEDIFYPVE